MYFSWIDFVPDHLFFRILLSENFYFYLHDIHQKPLKQTLLVRLWHMRCAPLHKPKTLETCKKSMPCLIQKASRCATGRTSKTSVFYLALSIKHKDLTRKSCMFIFYLIGSVVKIVYFYFLYIKDD